MGSGLLQSVLNLCSQLNAGKKDPLRSPGARVLVGRGMDSTVPHPAQVSPQLPLASPDLCLGIASSQGIELNHK